jgi:hypothetical protein
MRAAPDHLVPYGHGNVVDEPALRWLARQRAPRYWVSDGGVSGVGDRSSAGVQRRCAEICRVAEIRRFPSAGVAVRELESGAPGRRRLRIEPKEQ